MPSQAASHLLRPSYSADLQVKRTENNIHKPNFGGMIIDPKRLFRPPDTTVHKTKKRQLNGILVIQIE